MCNLSIFTYYCTNPHCPRQEQPYKQLRIEQVCVPVYLEAPEQEHKEEPWIWTPCHIDQCGSCKSNGAGHEFEAKDFVEFPSVTDCVAFYAKRLGLEIRTTMIAIDIASNAVRVLQCRESLALIGACIFVSSHLVDEPKDVEELGEGLSVDVKEVQDIYRMLSERRTEIVPESLSCHDGLDMERLPEPKARKEEDGENAGELAPWWDGLH